MPTTAATIAGSCPPPGGPPGLQVFVLLGAKAAAVILEVFVAGKALGTACAAELVVARVGTLVLSQVGAAAEGLAAQCTLVELHAWGQGHVSKEHWTLPLRPNPTKAPLQMQSAVLPTCAIWPCSLYSHLLLSLSRTLFTMH